MRIITEQGRSEMVYRKDINGFKRYSISISRKTDDGYENSYIDVKFKKGVELENRTKIFIKDAFMTFEKWTDKDGKARTNNCIMIMDFDALEDNTSANEIMKPKQKKDVWEEFGEELSDAELPF